jgi:hypothetical protein
MTETTTSEIVRLVPEGKELTDLKIVELDYASKKCGADVVGVCASKDHPNKQKAFACLALVWARRSNPSAVLETYLDMEVSELYQLLGLIGADGRAPEKAPQLDEDPAANPTASEPA